MRLLPADVVDVALIAADTCAAIGAMSVSWWHEEVRAGRAPHPAIRAPRCTRWRLSEVRAYWADRAASADAKAGEALHTQAIKASKAAKAARIAKRSASPEVVAS